MSLLLDALRKSANERHLGSPPGLEEGLRQTAPVAPQRRSWLAPILVIAILALIIIWQPWKQNSDTIGELVAQESASEQGAVTVVAREERPQAAVNVRERDPNPTDLAAGTANYDYESFPDVDEYAYESDDASYIAEQLYRSQVDPLDEDQQLEVDNTVARAILQEVLENSEESEEYREFISQIAAEERGEDEFPYSDDELDASSNPDTRDPLQRKAHQLPGGPRGAKSDPEDGAEAVAQNNSTNQPVSPGQLPTARRDAPVNNAERRPVAPAQSAATVAANSAQSGSNPAADEEEGDSDIGVVSYYELPVNIRTSLPEIDVQIRVYDADPAKRFVVTGKSRVTEGQAIADGVTLHKIRRDGLVLVFRSYVFLWDQR